MTQAKKLKKAIRARARKTGERYTAARRQVLLAREKRGGAMRPVAPTPARATAATPPAAPPVAKPIPASGLTRGLASDAAVVKKTGHGLDHWFAVLDAFGAPAKGHTAAARHLHEEHRVPGWHAQGITVAYERARGLRATNQAGNGRFQVSVSKTVGATVAEVAKAIGDAGQRRQWLRAADPGLARALEAAFAGPKARQVALKRADYARMRYAWDGATVEIHVYGKPKGGANVVASNEDLADAALVETRRSQWRAALASLKAHLAG
jgi:hypothetical protein